MHLRSTLAKTEKGLEEIESRKYKLDARTRALLLVINGKLTAGDLIKDFERLGDVVAMLKELKRGGFIKEADAAAAPGSAVRETRQALSALVYDALGPDGASVAVDVEDCKTVAQMRAYLESRRDIFDGVLGKQRAEQFWAKVAELCD